MYSSGSFPSYNVSFEVEFALLWPLNIGHILLSYHFKAPLSLQSKAVHKQVHYYK